MAAGVPVVLSAEVTEPLSRLGASLWHKPDPVFRTPRATLILRLGRPAHNASIEASVHTSLWRGVC